MEDEYDVVEAAGDRDIYFMRVSAYNRLFVPYAQPEGHHGTVSEKRGQYRESSRRP